MKKIILSGIFAGFLIFGGGLITGNNDFVTHAQSGGSGDSADYQDFDGIIPSEKNTTGETQALAKRIRQGQVGLGDVFLIIVKMIDLVSKLAGTVAVLFLIYGGYQYMIGSVTDDKEGAKKTIKYAIIGLIVTFMAYLIVNLVKVQFLGV